MILGMFGKFGALFVTIPDPIVGGVFMVMFGKSYLMALGKELSITAVHSKDMELFQRMYAS